MVLSELLVKHNNEQELTAGMECVGKANLATDVTGMPGVRAVNLSDFLDQCDKFYNELLNF